MKLYFTKGACSLAVRIVINEIGVDCTYESVNLQAKKTESGKNYLEINKKGAVPALQTDKGEILTENAVILQYLADTYEANKLLPPQHDFERYRVLECVNYITTEIHKTLGALFNPAMTSEIREKFTLPTLKTKFNYLNSLLDGQPYLCGNHLTLPDAYLFVMLTWTFHFKIDLQEWPNLVKHFNKLSQHPSVVKSLNEEGIELAG
ncbi:glutathione S-transferase [Legionella rubrilucens]|uniref:Glutathione S-transferase n=1 Tax=Legionella rubrilucens TaxID=458 RepID=A0A0W0Y1Q6_9GAMM|nr:glutathione transferase GstA [Legionella rubrilucens]KTD50623.1 glutathione S-transferase [Legionella rubrilucens]